MSEPNSKESFGVRPGQCFLGTSEPITEDYLAALSSTVNACATAVEVFGDDELERHARDNAVATEKPERPPTKAPFYAYATSPRAKELKRPKGCYGVKDCWTDKVLAGPFDTIEEAEAAADKIPGEYEASYRRYPLPGSRFAAAKAETA